MKYNNMLGGLLKINWSDSEQEAIVRSVEIPNVVIPSPKGKMCAFLRKEVTTCSP